MLVFQLINKTENHAGGKTAFQMETILCKRFGRTLDEHQVSHQDDE